MYLYRCIFEYNLIQVPKKFDLSLRIERVVVIIILQSIYIFNSIFFMDLFCLSVRNPKNDLLYRWDLQLRVMSPSTFCQCQHTLSHRHSLSIVFLSFRIYVSYCMDYSFLPVCSSQAIFNHLFYCFIADARPLFDAFQRSLFLSMLWDICMYRSNLVSTEHYAM